MNGRLLIAAAAVLWSTGGAAIKLSSLNGAQLAGGRAVVAGLVLFLVLPSSRVRWTRDVWIAGSAYAATCVLFVYANTLTTAGNAIFIQNVAPVWVLVVAPLALREQATFRERVTLPISLLGCALFFVEAPAVGGMTGNLIALGASFTYATLLIYYRKLRLEDGIAATVCGSVIIALVMAPFALDGPVPTTTDWLVLLHLGAIQQAGAVLLYVRGIREVTALSGALMVYLEPVLSPVWAFLLVGERLTPLAIGGGVLIVGAALWRALEPPQ
jgi:drug/metabolite transporter (DMT)-like permease